MKDDGILKDGIYEQVINKLISSRLAGDDRLVRYGPIDTEEAQVCFQSIFLKLREKGFPVLGTVAGILAHR